MMNASNPMQMITNMLNSNQMQAVNQFKAQPTEKQAEEIANLCNQKGITKGDLQKIINAFQR